MSAQHTGHSIQSQPTGHGAPFQAIQPMAKQQTGPIPRASVPRSRPLPPPAPEPQPWDAWEAPVPQAPQWQTEYDSLASVPENQYGSVPFDVQDNMQYGADPQQGQYEEYAQWDEQYASQEQATNEWDYGYEGQDDGFLDPSQYDAEFNDMLGDMTAAPPLETQQPNYDSAYQEGYEFGPEETYGQQSEGAYEHPNDTQQAFQENIQQGTFPEGEYQDWTFPEEEYQEGDYPAQSEYQAEYLAEGQYPEGVFPEGEYQGEYAAEGEYQEGVFPESEYQGGYAAEGEYQHDTVPEEQYQGDYAAEGEYQEHAFPEGEYQGEYAAEGEYQEGTFPDGEYQHDTVPEEQYQGDYAAEGECQAGTFPEGEYQGEYATEGEYQEGAFPEGEYQEGTFPDGEYQGEYAAEGEYQEGTFPDGEYQHAAVPEEQYQGDYAAEGEYQEGAFPEGEYQDGTFPDGEYQGEYAAEGEYPDGTFPDGEYQQDAVPEEQYQEDYAAEGEYQENMHLGDEYQKEVIPESEYQDYPTEGPIASPGKPLGDYPEGEYPQQYLSEDIPEGEYAAESYAPESDVAREDSVKDMGKTMSPPKEPRFDSTVALPKGSAQRTKPAPSKPPVERQAPSLPPPVMEPEDDAWGWNEEADDQDDVYAHDAYASQDYGTQPAQVSMPDHAKASIPIAAFGIGGQLAIHLPHAKPQGDAFEYTSPHMQRTVQIHSLAQFVGARPFSTLDMHKFPGPLLDGVRPNKQKKAQVVQYLQDQINESASGIGYLRRKSVIQATGVQQNDANEWRRTEDKVLLLKLLVLLVEHDGKLADDPSLSATIGDLLQNRNETADEFSAFNVPTYPRSSSQSAMKRPIRTYTLRQAFLEELQTLLQQGQVSRAVEWALQEKMWAHAMTLSRQLDKATQDRVVTEFVNYELGGADVDDAMRKDYTSIKVAYSLYTQQTPEQIAALFRGPSTLLPDAQHVQWRQAVATLLSNRDSSSSHNSVLRAIGDGLMASGLPEAAHVCYLLAHQHRAWFKSPENPTCILLGTMSDSPIHTVLNDMDALLMTEVMEYAYALNQPKSTEPYVGIPALAPFKIVMAAVFDELGDAKRAKKYCDALANLSRTKNATPILTPQLQMELHQLTSRLNGQPMHGDSLSWKARRPTLDGVWGALEGRLTKFIAGEEGNEQKGAELDSKKAAEEPVGAFTHYSAITPEAASLTSDAPQPIDSTEGSYSADAYAQTYAQDPSEELPDQDQYAESDFKGDYQGDLAGGDDGYQGYNHDQGEYAQEYPEGEYPEDNYEGDFAQENYPEDAYAQEGYNKGEYPLDNYAEGDYAQEGFAEDAYAQEDYHEGEYPPQEYGGDYAQDGHPENPYDQEGYNEGEYPPEEYAEGGDAQEAYPEDQYAQESYAEDEYNEGEYPTEEYAEGDVQDAHPEDEYYQDDAGGEREGRSEGQNHAENDAGQNDLEGPETNEDAPPPVFHKVDSTVDEDGLLSTMPAPTLEPAASPAPSKAPPKKPVEDDEDDDLGFGNTSHNKTVEKEPEQKQDTTPKESEPKPADKPSSNSSWLGRLLGSRSSHASSQQNEKEGKAVRAHLGEETSFYYDKELKRWVNKKAGDDANAKPAPLPPPPKKAPAPAKPEAPAAAPPPSSSGGSTGPPSARAGAPPPRPPASGGGSGGGKKRTKPRYIVVD